MRYRWLEHRAPTLGLMATVDYAAVCEAIEPRPSVQVWPNVARLGKNRVDAETFPATFHVPLLVAVRLSKEEAAKGPQVLQLLIEIVDVTNEMNVVQRIELSEPIEDYSAVTTGPVGFPLLITPVVELTLPRSAPFLVRVKGWSGHYDFLLAAVLQS